MKRRLLSIAGGVIILVAAGVGAASAGQGTSVPQNAATASPVSGVTTQTPPSYPRNAKGMTFGSELDAPSPDLAPDLISAIATNGSQGYVRKTDLYAQLPTNPSDAAKYEASSSTARRISVYAQDGETVIGTFVISPPSIKVP